ncbi:MAG: hypothetical protein WC333_00425 [Dehalococcoidia bacterium]|jgi:hypothetical protein
MKTENLDLLLNKVVEYNQPGKCRFKGFLYKDRNGQHYIKVIETFSGTDIAVDDKLVIRKGEGKYVASTDKPKLMRVSMKSWHYRLIKFVLKDNAPTPKTMQNGCPYFWLLVFSFFAAPFLLLWKGFVFLILLLPRAFVWFLEKAFDAYMKSLDDAAAYDYYQSGQYGSTGSRMPLTVKTFFKLSSKNDYDDRNEFMDYFLLEKYNLSSEKNPEEYKRMKDELSEKYLTWREEIKKRNEEREKQDFIEREKRRIKQLEWERKQEIRQAKWDALTKPYRDGINGILKSIRQTFTFKVKKVKFDFDWKTIIRTTKQVVGAIITLILLTATYFVVNGIAYGLTAAADWSIHHWEYFAIMGLLLVAAGIVYVSFIFITGWVQGIVNRYKGGKRVWYIEPLIYVIYYPIKYVVLLIAYGLFYIVWWPIKFICYTFLFKIVIAPVGEFLAVNIWKGLCAFGRGLVNSTGVFGEYFSASYTDYCPGLEWVDTDEEENN